MKVNKLGDHRPEKIFLMAKSGETSLTIPRGTPVCLKMFGNDDDGLTVVLPSNAGTGGTALAFGVTGEAFSPGYKGDVQAYGFNNQGTIVRQTRSATTVSWASVASIDKNVFLNIDTVNNCFATLASTLPSAFLPAAVLLDTIASIAGSASATSDTRTALTSSIKAFLRML